MPDKMHRTPDEAWRPPAGRGPALTEEERDLALRYAAAGWGTRRIAARLGRSRKAIQRLLRRERGGPMAPPPIPGKLDGFRERIREMAARRLTVSRILRELREAGYTGGRTILADFVRTLRGPQPRKSRVKRRFTTPPGQECQIDFSPYRVPLAGRPVTVHAFAAVLHHSRKAHVRFYPDERLPVVLEGLVTAWEDFGGVTLHLVLDRIVAAVLGRIGHQGRVLWHPDFEALCQHYGTAPVLCKPRDSDRKGAVEKLFQYLEADFVRGSAWGSLAAMNAAAQRWLQDVANARTHGTTGKVPDAVWAQEREFLIRLPEDRFAFWREETRRVDDDATLSIGGTRFTVPAELAPGTVRVRRYAGRFEVLDREGQVAFARPYAEGDEKGRLIIDPEHYGPPPPRSTTRAEGPAVRDRERRFLRRFGELAALLDGIKARTKTFWPVHLGKLDALSRRFGEEAFRQAALRAQAHGAFNAEAVRRILERDYPLADEPPIPPVRGADRVQRLLGEVDPGSLDSYAELDRDEVPDDDGDDAAGEVCHAS